MTDWQARRAIKRVWRAYGRHYRAALDANLPSIDPADLEALTDLHQDGHTAGLSALRPDNAVLFREVMELEGLEELARRTQQDPRNLTLSVIARLWMRTCIATFDRTLPAVRLYRDDLALDDPIAITGWAFSYALADANGSHPAALRDEYRDAWRSGVNLASLAAAERAAITASDLQNWLTSPGAVDGLTVRDRLNALGAFF